MRYNMLMLCILLWVQSGIAQPDTIQRIIHDRFNSIEQQQKPYLVMISCDGFRYDYAVKHGAKNILALSAKGVRAEGMIPAYPTLTFPNHYTLATGLYPSHHGLVNNYFYDRKRAEKYSMKNRAVVGDGSWYGGNPLWVLAEQQQMLTASLYWVGTEAAIQGIRPTYYYNFSEAFSIHRKIDIVREWLTLPPERRPHFISIYFSETDHAGHDFGPDSPEARDAVQLLDKAIQQLTEAAKSTGLDVNFVLVSDHGMTNVNPAKSLPIPSIIDSTKFITPRGAELLMLYAKQPQYILPLYKKLRARAKHYDVRLQSDMPDYLHYGIPDDRFDRIGDILLIPQWPRAFTLAKKDRGAHGFDPYLVKDMQAIFYAWGPAFKKGIEVPAFENVNVYPVITSVLGLHYTEPIDGTHALADSILE